MSEWVIACYRPKPDMEVRLEEIVRGHVPRLRELGYATSGETMLLRSTDGSFLEIFEWTSAEHVERAHHDPEVKKIWDAFGAACSYATLDSLPESHAPFPHFERLR